MRSSPASWLSAVLTLSFVPAAWRTPAFGAFGVAAGMGLVTARVSELPSYLSDSPRTCVNCHIMAPEYATWQRSSHQHVTNCNDCHVPHDSAARKYYFKAKDGSRHAAIFALRREPQVITAHAPSRRVIEENCRRCHATVLEGAPSLRDGKRACADCHQLPHGEVHSLASTPYVPRPALPPVTTWPYGTDW